MDDLSFLQELEENADGFMEIIEKNGEACLKIEPPAGKGRAISLTDVKNRLGLLKIAPYESVNLEAISSHPDSQFHKIGKWPGIAHVERNYEIKVKISDNALSASIEIMPGTNSPAMLDQSIILSALADAGIVYGISVQEIKRICEKVPYLKEVLVAEGDLPVKGVDGRIRVLFDMDTRIKPKEGANRRVDYKNINVIRSVKAGELLAELVEPQPGKDGKNVRGEILYSQPGLPADWKLGQNVRLTEDNKKLFSQIQGRPVIDSRGVIRVDEIIYLKSIDYSTGNVDFPGTIVVEERMADGFSLTTIGSIIINDSVGAVTLKAGGDIVLSAGFMGRNSGSLDSGGDVYARFAESAFIKAKGSIFITDASLHSTLIAGDSIYMKGGRGEFTGGEAIAGYCLQCNKLGGVAETKTRVTVGTSPGIISQMEALQNSINDKEKTIERVRQTLQKLDDASKKRPLADDEKITKEKLIIADKKFSSLLTNEKKQYDIARTGFQAQSGAHILIENELYPGVEMNFGQGKIFRSPLKVTTGRNVYSIAEDGSIKAGNTIPRRE